MEYFINTGTLIVTAIIFALMCLGFLTTYSGKKTKPKKKKKADPYHNNPYVYAHKKMIKDSKEYEDDIASLDAAEVEKYERKYGTPKTSTNIEDWYKY